MTAILLPTEQTVGDEPAVILIATRRDGLIVSAVLARSVAGRAATLLDWLVSTGTGFGVEGTAKGDGLIVTGGPADLDGAPEGKLIKGRVEFARSDVEPYVIPGPDEFPDVLPGSSGPLAAAVQLFTGLPMTGYLSHEDGAAVAALNDRLGLDPDPTFTAATAAAYVAALAPRPARSKR